MYADKAFITNCDRSTVSTIQAEESDAIQSIHWCLRCMQFASTYTLGNHHGQPLYGRALRKRRRCFCGYATTDIHATPASQPSTAFLRPFLSHRNEQRPKGRRSHIVSQKKEISFLTLAQPFTAHIDPDRTERKYASDSKGDHLKVSYKSH